MTVNEPPQLTAEDPSVAIRMVVAPHAGSFHSGLGHELGDGDVPVAPGQVIGTIDNLGERVSVTSPFEGTLKGLLVEAGQRVHAGQPLAWVGL